MVLRDQGLFGASGYSAFGLGALWNPRIGEAAKDFAEGRYLCLLTKLVSDPRYFNRQIVQWEVLR